MFVDALASIINYYCAFQYTKARPTVYFNVMRGCMNSFDTLDEKNEFDKLDTQHIKNKSASWAGTTETATQY